MSCTMHQSSGLLSVAVAWKYKLLTKVNINDLEAFQGFDIIEYIIEKLLWSSSYGQQNPYKPDQHLPTAHWVSSQAEQQKVESRLGQFFSISFSAHSLLMGRSGTFWSLATPKRYSHCTQHVYYILYARRYKSSGHFFYLEALQVREVRSRTA